MSSNAPTVEAEDADETQGAIDGDISSRRIVRALSPFHCDELIACSACVASIIRVPYIAATSLIDPSWSDTYGAIWSVVELTMGIVCACLPTLRPLYLHLFPRLATQASRSKTSDKSSSANSGGVKLRYLRMPGFEGNGGWSLSDPTNHRHEKDSKIPAVNEGESV